MPEQVIEFLAGGFSLQEVATTLGIGVPQVTEMLKSAEFVDKVKSRAKELQQDRIEKRYTDLEEATLKQIKTDLGMMDAAALCRVLETVSRNRIAARAPANHFTNPTSQGALNVTLVLPAGSDHITVDSKNQVIAIGDRSMAAMPVQGVQALFSTFEAHLHEQQGDQGHEERQSA